MIMHVAVTQGATKRLHTIASLYCIVASCQEVEHLLNGCSALGLAVL